MALKLNFEDWKQEVAKLMFHRLGLHPDDLPDWTYRAAWEDGMSPRTACAKAIKAAKKEMGV